MASWLPSTSLGSCAKAAKRDQQAGGKAINVASSQLRLAAQSPSNRGLHPCEAMAASEALATMSAAAEADAPDRINSAALIMSISAILEGRDLHSFSMKDMLGALEERLGMPSKELQTRKSEILELVQAEVQRMSNKENQSSSKNAKNRGGSKRKTLAEVDWQRMLGQREAKVQKMTHKMGEKSVEPNSEPEIQKPEISEDSTPTALTMGLKAVIADHAMELSPKTFSSGAQGFHALQRLSVTLDGKPRSIMCQVSCALLKDELA